MDISPKNSSNLIERLLTYKGTEATPYVERFNKAWIINAIDELNVMKCLEAQFKNYDAQGCDVIDFTKAMLNIISHEEDETLYITIGLIDLHKEICETFGLKDRVKVADVLNYTIENFVNKEWRTHIIATKKIPEKKKFGGDQAEVREIDINAPTVYGNSSGGIMRLTNSKMVTDSQRHNNDTLNRVCFSPEVKKLFTLDSAAGSISMYNINGGLEKKISPKGSNKEEIIILDFVWSHKQNRIGACLKDFALIFWDFSDNFEFEMNVPIRKWVSEYQTNIWYLDFLNVWVTTDKSHQLNVWNIEKDVKHFNLTSPHTKASIIDIIVIDLLKLVAVSTMDKRVTLWDFKKKAIVLELDLAQFSIHTMAWSNTYQVLVTAGYESTINLWSINPVYLDYTLVGKLEGHTSTITAVSIIENTSMLISVDDLLKIKMWDLRNLKCVQTLELEAKVFVTKIIDMYMFGKLCFISSRINFLEFDTLSMETSNKVQEDRESIWPIGVEYNFHSNELAICTRKDLRFIDLGSGRTKKIYEGLLPNEEDDITAFRLIHQDKKFLLGDQRGRLGLYSYATGEKLKGLVSQSEEVNNLRVDVVNKMIVSSSWDNTIFIQKESNLGYELKRTVRNIHHNRETSILEISVYHNIFVTATNSNMLYVWDYEFMKVMGIIELEEDTEPTCVSFINGDSSLVLADSSGKIHLIRFAKEGFSRICFERTGVIRIDDSAQDHELFVNRILIDIDCISQSGQNTHKVRMYASTNKGEVKVYDLSEFVKSDLSQALAQSGPRGNYKSDRIVNEDFITQVKTYRIYTYSLKDTKSSSPEPETQSPHTDLLLMENSLIGEFQAHKDSLTTLILMVSPDKKILTSSLDEYVKIWALNGALVASLNVNHPLPVMWNISSDDSLKNQTKVINALKLIDTITQHSKVKLTHAEKKMYSIERFLKGVVLLENDSDEDYGHRQFRYKKNEAADSPRKQKVLLMKDEYSPRDFQFNRAKEVYQRELQGPTLRQLEIAHKLAAGQKAGEPKKSDLYEEEDHSFRREREYEGTKKLKDGGMVLSKRTKLLEKKLEKISLLPNQPVKKHSIQPKKGGSRKGSSDPKKFQSRILDEIQLNGKVGENHNEEVVTHQGIGKRSMSIQMDGLKDRVKLKPLKIAQKEGMLTAIAKELNPTTKVSFRENEGRKVPLKDEYPSKSSRLIAEKVARYGPSGELGRQDFNIVLSKLDSILKKPQSPSLQLKDFHRVGLVSNRASNLYSGKNASQNGIESDLKSPSQKSNTDNEKKGKLDTGRSGRAPHERMVSFDQFIKKTAQNYFSEASRPKEEEKKTIKLGQSEKNEKELAKVQSSEALKDEEPDFLSPNNAPIDYKKYQRNSGVDFEPLEETFSSMGQFFKKPKKPTMFKRLGSLSPNSKGNKKVLISQKSNKGNAWPLGFE